MSNPGQAILTIGGTIIGAFFGNPQLGFMLGSMAGQALFPTELPTARGPRLDDLKAQTSQIGAPIPLVFGAFSVAGNVIWASDLKETKHKQKAGGKGGGPTQKQVTYSYSQSLAIGLCECPAPGVPALQGIRRIWANGKPIYDRTPQRADEEYSDFIKRLAASAALDQIMTVYDGTQTTADPTIETFEEVGNVPAYVGLGYVVLADLQLEDYGNRVPNLQFEVYTDGTSTLVDTARYSNEVLYPWKLDQRNPADPRNTNKFYNTSLPEYPTFEEYMAGQHPTWPVHAFGYATSSAAYSNVYPAEGSPGAVESVGLYVKINCYLPGPGAIYDYIPWTLAAPGLLHEVGGVIGNNNLVWWSGNEKTGGGSHQWTGLWYYAETGSTSDWYALYATLPDPPSDTGTSNPPPYYKVIPDSYAILTRAPGVPPIVDAGWIAIPDAPGFYVDAAGDVQRGYSWVKDTSTTYKVLQAFTTSGGVVTKYPRSPALPLGHVDYSNSTFWTDAYNAAVAAGDMPAGLTYGVDYPVTQSYAYKDGGSTAVININPISVSSILSALCARVGLQSSDIDVTGVTKMLFGYAVSTVSPARQSIEPLLTYALAEAVESGTKLKFVTRGGSVARTLTADDLGAYNGDEPTPAVEVSRVADVELPRSLTVQYANADRDYQPDAQVSARVTTATVNDIGLQVPVSMTDTTALRLADALMFDAWMARNSYKFAIPARHCDLEPTDVIQVPVSGVTERMRILRSEFGAPGMINVEAVRDDAAVLTSYSTRTPALGGALSPYSTPALAGRMIGPTDLAILILKGLRQSDNDGGYYVAGRGYLKGWSGFEINTSFDGGTQYDPIVTQTDAATMGRVSASFGSGSTTLQVTLDSGTFSAATSAQLDAGANLLAVGDNGRWELLQFETASLSAGVWTLGGLRRGVRDTGAYTGTTVVGDRAVLMSGPGITRVPLSSTLVGVSHLLKPVSLGTSVDDTTPIAVTSTGDSLQGGGLTLDSNGNLAVDIGDSARFLAAQVFGP